MVRENEDEEDLTEWESKVSKDLKDIKKEQKRLTALVTERLEKGAKEPKHKEEPPASRMNSMIKECTTWLTDFDINKFVALAQKEGIVGNNKFSDEDIALIRKALPDPDLFFEEIDYREAVKVFHEELGIDPSRFEAVAKAKPVYLPVDEEYWAEEVEEAEETEEMTHEEKVARQRELEEAKSGEVRVTEPEGE